MEPIQRYTEANLTSLLKREMPMYDHHFSNFGRPPVPNDLCIDSAIGHPRFSRSRFLKVLSYMSMAAILVNGRQLF